MQPRADGMISVEVEFDATYVDVDELIANVTKAAEGLVAVKVDLDTKWESCYAKVVGWRLPTEDEKRSMAAAEVINERNARDTLIRIRRDFPDLFDADGRPRWRTLEGVEDEIPF